MNRIKSLFTAIIPALFIAGVVAASTTISQNIVTEGDLTVGGSVGIGKTSGIDDTLSIFGTLGLAPDATSSPDVRLQRGGAGNLQFIGAHTISTTAGNLTLNPSGGQTDVTGDLNATGSYLGDGSKLSGIPVSVGENLVSYWKFEDNLLDTGLAQDLSLGAGTTTFIDTPFGRGLDYDGLTRHEANDADYDREHNQPFSIEFWVNFDSGPNDEFIISKRISSTSNGFILWRWSGASGEILFRLQDDSLNVFEVSTSTALQNGTWYHIVATYAGNSNHSGMKIYVNGVLESTGPSAAISNTILNDLKLTIGAASQGNQEIDGQLSHVRFYNTELTAKQIETLFHAR